MITTEQALDRLAEICDLQLENDQLREENSLLRQQNRQLSELVQHRIGHAIDETIPAEPGGAEI
jgi:hypothetical protein